MTREELIGYLKSIDGYISGETLSNRLGVSRTAVWKHIGELRKEGYVIESSPNKGYKLTGVPSMHALELSYGLDTAIMGRDIRYYDCLDSTNTAAKTAAAEGCSEGTVIVTDVQTAGRGRMGREWNSAGGKGIWMSVVLRPILAPEDVQLITVAASVAAARAIDKAAGIKAGIKWPNDLILNGKKVCGILTEMSTEIDRINYLILGIGLNVSHDTVDFPEELKEKATSLKAYLLENNPSLISEHHLPDRKVIFKEILKQLEEVYKLLGENPQAIIGEWKKWTVTLGRQLRITIRDTEYSGAAVDITSQGRLVVKCSDGITREVMSGEVSVRGIMGYA